MAKWIEEQNEFLGKQKEKEIEKDKKERDPQYLTQMDLSKSCRGQELATELVMNKPPNI